MRQLRVEGAVSSGRIVFGRCPRRHSLADDPFCLVAAARAPPPLTLTLVASGRLWRLSLRRRLSHRNVAYAGLPNRVFAVTG